MKFRFSGNIPEIQKERIKRLFNFVKSNSAPALLVRVAYKLPDEKGFYRMYSKIGYYKNISEHGFYDSEWDRVYRKLGCKHIIQLFIKNVDSDEYIIRLMAHEWRHYLQYTKPSLRKKFVIGNKRVEVDARKYENKIANKWKEFKNDNNIK